MEQQGKPFIWGTTDCVSLARAALIEMFGPEITPRLPRWKNERDAALILKKRGSVGRFLEELGAERTSVPFIRAGDLAVSPEPEEVVGRESVMVCLDGLQCLASTKEGVVLTTPDTGSIVYSLWGVEVQ